MRAVYSTGFLFGEAHVLALAGLTVRRLRRWCRTGLFVPAPWQADADETRSIPPLLYTFGDGVTLCALERLRGQHGIGLQDLRGVAAQLRDLQRDLWASTQFFITAGGRVRLGSVTGGAPPEGHLAFALVQIMDDTEAAVRTLRTRQASQIGRISQSPAVCGNAPVFAGTRIPVGAVRRLHEDGYSVAQILVEYPSLAEQDVTAVIGRLGQDVVRSHR
jgi:uncharacterized protein (DUF433 family)